MTSYVVLYEQADDGSWSARAADLPVYAVGTSRDEAEREVREAIALHLEELAAAGEPVPPSRSAAGTVVV